MMKFLYIISFFIYFLNIIHNITAYKPRIYMRIPQHFVHDRVIQFLNTNRINRNTFEIKKSKWILKQISFRKTYIQQFEVS